MKKLIKSALVMLVVCCPVVLYAQAGQQINQDSLFRDSMANYEYQLASLSDRIINGEDEEERMTSTYYFIQKLKTVLKIPGSFNYPFDSLKTISILKSENNDFRIFTWNLALDNGQFKYFGAIQLNSPDSLVLYGLYDFADTISDIQNKELDNHEWPGALYYKMIQYTYKKKNYALLLGWDGNDNSSNKKIIEVLTFDAEKRPVLGAPIFKMSDAKDAKPQYRIVFEFSNQAAMTLRYEASKNIIAFEHLAPQDERSEGIYSTYLPDGGYDYLQFKKGLWIKKENLFEKVKIKMENDPADRKPQRRTN